MFLAVKLQVARVNFLPHTQGLVKSLMRKMVPVARRVLGENHNTTLKMSWAYARALYKAEGATLDNLREAVTTLEDVQRTVRRVFGGAHPDAVGIKVALQDSRAALRARETPSAS